MATTTPTTTSVANDATATVERSKPEPIKIKLPLEAFILKTPEGDISEAGQNEIEWYLMVTLSPASGTEKNYHPMPDDFEWKWVTNRGTLPKRIQAHYYKNYQYKLSPEVIQSIGNLGRQHSSKEQIVVVDFTDSIDWHDGDYGDGGSCFWGDKSGARTMIEKNGWAMRLYKPKAGFTIDPTKPIKWNEIRGYARCWAADIGGKVIVFNGYGENTITFARMLSLKFACSYKRIVLTNNGYDDSTLWINGAVGYIVGEHSQIQSYTKHDLGWPDEQGSYICENCEARIHDGDELSAYDSRGYTQTVCEDCAHTCKQCGENFVYELAEYEDSYRCNECHNDRVKRDIREIESELSDAETDAENLKEKWEEADNKRQELQDKLDELEGVLV